MRKLTAVVLLLAMVLGTPQAFALDGQEVAYVTGTMKTVKEGTVGTLDTASATALEFHSSAGNFSIPYTRIKSYRYREETKFHLGVLPAIAVSLVKKRAKVHFVTITWKGEQEIAEVVTLELSKNGSRGLMAILDARATEVHKPKPGRTATGAGEWDLPLGTPSGFP
jgi:hypothetical protein